LGLRTSVALCFRVAKPDLALFVSVVMVFVLDWLLVDLVDWPLSFDFAIVVDYEVAVFFLDCMNFKLPCDGFVKLYS